MNKKSKPKELSTKKSAANKNTHPTTATPLYLWLFFIAGITALCLSPMLKNGFTNWDDDFYVLNNLLLRGPDWKGIFWQPVVSNYHPLTVISLAFNYRISGTDAFSYHLFNFILHIINTGLVFYFIWLISDKKIWVAVLSALIFGIHPMHVESVAWISERKDLLYSLFFLAALIQYWRYIQTGKMLRYWLCFLLFVLSLLSKPAAVILPLVLFLLDYWKNRAYSTKLLVEKIPFFLGSVIMGILTLYIQSQKAVAGLDLYPVWERVFFACYGIMIYSFRFIFPLTLSAFHPYPDTHQLGPVILLSPLFVGGLGILLWYFRKNKLVIFSILFFIVNLLLVLQLVAIGNTLVAERYTYMPYIGLAFLGAMWLNNYISKAGQKYGWVAVGIITFVFGLLTFQRTKVWHDSITLWTDVLSHYPNRPVPCTNRANAYFQMAMDPAHASEANDYYAKALEDCRVALTANPAHVAGYENQGIVNLNLLRYKEALADGEAIIRLAPDKKEGYLIRGKALANLGQPEKALADFNKCIALYPADDDAVYSRGAVIGNTFQNYQAALADFDKAIALRPLGLYYMSRAFCYQKLGDLAKAKADAQLAQQMGQQVPADFLKLLNP